MCSVELDKVSSHLRVARLQLWHRIQINSLLTMFLTDHIDVRKSLSDPIEHGDMALHVAHSLWVICPFQGFSFALLAEVLAFPEQQVTEGQRFSPDGDHPFTSLLCCSNGHTQQLKSQSITERLRFE